MLSQRLKVACLVAVAAFLYYWAVGLGAHVLSGPTPTWWLPTYERTLAVYSWLQLTHAGGLLVVSAPFALAIALLSREHPLRFALAVALLGLVVPSLYFWVTTPTWVPEVDTVGLVSRTIDFIKFLVTLPLLTWAARRVLPPNSSFKPKPLRGSA